MAEQGGLMFSPGELLALSDDELAIYLNGGYGAEKRNMALATVRRALQKEEANTKAAVDEIMAKAASARLM